MAFESLSDKLTAAFKKLRGKGRLTQADIKEAMREVRLALLEADVSYKVVKDFTKTVTERASGAEVLEALSPAQMVIKIVNEELCALMGGENEKLNISSKTPSVVMLVGLQGAGKTTNGAKLAGYIRKQGKRPLLVACDIYRPAAIKQLETVGAQLDIPVFQMGQTNPVDIAKASIEHAKKHGNDIVFLDTAGRLHIDEALIDIEDGTHARMLLHDAEPCAYLLEHLFWAAYLTDLGIGGLYIEHWGQIARLKCCVLEEKLCLDSTAGAKTEEVVGSDTDAVFTCLLIVLSVVAIVDGGALCTLDEDERYRIIGCALHVLMTSLAEEGDTHLAPVDRITTAPLFVLITGDVDAVDSLGGIGHALAPEATLQPLAHSQVWFAIGRGKHLEAKAMTKVVRKVALKVTAVE